MLQLIYSSVAVAEREINIADLCAVSQRNNRQHEITGIFLFTRGRFLQVIEGPRGPVEDTFLRIIVDPRHDGLMLLSRKLVTARYFGSWEMACMNDQDAQDKVVRQVAAQLTDAPEHLRNGFFQTFVAPRLAEKGMSGKPAFRV